MGRLFLSLFLLLVGGSLVYWVFTDLIFEPKLQAFEDELFLQEARAPLWMTSQKLAETPQEKWRDVVSEMQGYYSGSPSLIPESDLNFSPEDRLQLHETPIFVLESEQGLTAFHLVDNSDLVLVYGPQEDLHEMEVLDDRLRMGWVGLMALLMLVWIGFLYWRINRVKKSLDAIRLGDFKARTDIRASGFIGDLGRTFDQMAGRIEQMLKEKTHLIAAVSHEMRTPLSRLAFSRHFLEERVGDDEESVLLLAEMKADFKHLEDLVTDLLSYSRLEFQLSHADKEVVAIVPWIERLTQRFHPREDKRLVLEWRDAVMDVQVVMVANMLEKAFNNTIDNALRHCCHKVFIRAEKNPAWVWFHIDDDGPGIALKDRKRIFEPFVRLDESRNRDDGGWGLGTALAQQIVHWHDGQLVVAESPEGGARFSIGLQPANQPGIGPGSTNT